jgi:hypothetical protein
MFSDIPLLFTLSQQRCRRRLAKVIWSSWKIVAEIESSARRGAENATEK